MSLLYLLLFLTPFHSDPRLGVVLLRTGVAVITPIKVLGLLAAAVALLAPSPKYAAPRLWSPLIGLFIPFAIVPVVATIAYGLPTPDWAISQLMSAALLFAAIIPMVRTRERMVKVVRALTIGFAFGSLWVFKQHFIEHAPRAWGLEGDGNYEALMLLLALPFAFWMARHEQNRLWRRCGVVCTLLLALALLFTESRGGVIAGAAIGLLAALRSRNKLIGLALVLITAIGVFTFGPSGLSARFKSIKIVGQPLNGAEDSSRIHVELNKAGIYMMVAHPIFGVGLGEFKAVAPQYNPELVKLSKRSWIAHDTFVQIGSEEGMPTLLLFIAMLVVALRNSRATQRCSDECLAALGRAMEFSLIAISVVALSISVEFLPFCIVIILSQSLREVAETDDCETSSAQRTVIARSPIWRGVGGRSTRSRREARLTA